jgi:hypothetical protein
MISRRKTRKLPGVGALRLGSCGLAALLLLAGVVGCTRTFYRDFADNEVTGILNEKDKTPLWGIEQWHVYPDARSRFADPSNPDHPPMPPDDIASFAYSPHPQAPTKSGVGLVQGTAWLEIINFWDTLNRNERKAAEEAEKKEEDKDSGGADKELAAQEEEGPRLGGGHIRLVADKQEAGAAPKAPFDSPKNPVATYFDQPLNAQPPGFLLKLDQAVEMGVLNSNIYQTFREQLYEFGLTVTQQRFNFAYQWAATSDWVRQWAGPLSSAAGSSSSSSASSSSTTSSSTSSSSTAQQQSTTSTPSTTTNSQVTSSGSNTASSNTSGSGSSTTNTSTNSTSTSTSTAAAAGPSGVNSWTGQSSLSFSKLFVTGALLTFDFVNNNVWNFANPKSFYSFSTVNLSFVQPFLQGGGKAVTLEPLTEAERSLLYAIRAYARFREQFYVAVAIGASLPTDLPTAAGGTGSNPISVLAALGIASTDVSGGFVGYLSTLYRECDTAADKKLVQDLERALRIYEGYQEGGQFSPLQVDQVRSTLLNARNTVLTDQQFVTNALDQFKLVLGMPANLPLILDDTPARPITRQLDRYYTVISDSDDANKLVERQESVEPAELRAFLLRLFATSKLVRGTDFRSRSAKMWRAWRELGEKELKARLDKQREERRKLLDKKTEVELKGEALGSEDAARLRDLEVDSDLGALEQVLRRYEAKGWLAEANPALREVQRVKAFRLVAYSAEVVLVWARNQRFDAVTDLWPELPKAPLGALDLSTAEVAQAQQTAVQWSLSHRWDLMNARSQLVDSWRQLRVTANALMGVFNVQYNLNSTTNPTGTHPFAFSTSRTDQTLTLETQLPLNRLTQRNAYRTALINYQEQRRSLITFEDNIAVQVRFDVRQLQLFAANYRIQKRVLRALYAQVESALELITAPADPSALQASGTTGQANAAALTSQYLTALSSLNGAQTKMYDIWLSYLATRMQLYLDLESLRMDNRGVWIEPTEGFGSDGDCQAVAPAGPAPGGAALTPGTPTDRPARLPTPDAGRPGEVLPLPRPVDKGS